MKKVRSDEGLTYGIGSGFSSLRAGLLDLDLHAQGSGSA